MTDTKETSALNPENEGIEPPRPEDFSREPIPENIQLVIGHGNEKTRLQLKFQGARLMVGRDDGQAEIEIDMNPYGAFENGVSRRHAAFLRRDEGVFIEDLGSTNGTRINGFTLSANKAYRLRNGDEIEFGRMRTIIRFVRS